MIFYLSPNQFIDTTQSIDVSLALRASEDNPKAWYVAAPRMEPVRANGFVGSVAEGGAVNFRERTSSNIALHMNRSSPP